MQFKQSYGYWKLYCDAQGRQQWSFEVPAPFNSFSEQDWRGEQGVKFLGEMCADFCKEMGANPNSADLVYRLQQMRDNQELKPNNVFDAAHLAVQFYQTLQDDSGHWPGDYGGPLFLTPGMIIASYITQAPFPAPQRELLKQYFLNHQNEDGGWGLHIEGQSTMFGTCLQYVALRILGLGANNEAISKARNWIKKNGGATGIPSWGKFYLAVLGVYDWRGLNSLLPEMWLLPQSLPMHPGRYWCHARMVYLPMAYCFGNRVQAEVTALVKELRTELYTEDYLQIDWIKARNTCSASDLYYPQSGLLKLLNRLLNIYEKAPIKALRAKANKFILDYINAEDEHTSFIDIGPVNQVINSICIWHQYGKESTQFKKHVERWQDYLWVAEDGMKMNGYNGSQLWDTAFATQAIMEGGFHKSFPECIEKAYRFIDNSQVKEEVREPQKYFRHNSVGGWPFSTVQHGWPITDCTSEGLKATLQIHGAKIHGFEKKIGDNRLLQAADLILSFQNKQGGWATYELTRAPAWLELLNPSEVFGNIMIDYSYTECTSACIQALMKFREQFPAHRKSEIERSISLGIEFILAQQRLDGSWYGSWAVCFTYGSWFAAEALSAFLKSGIDHSKSGRINTALGNLTKFLLGKQNKDGGWGESFESCIKQEYVPHIDSQIINTAWAILSLMAIGKGEETAVEAGIKLLLSRQQANGDFPQEGISGVFNHNCGITYTSYRNIFPIWSLGRYLNWSAKKDLTIREEASLQEEKSVF